MKRKLSALVAPLLSVLVFSMSASTYFVPTASASNTYEYWRDVYSERGDNNCKFAVEFNGEGSNVVIQDSSSLNNNGLGFSEFTLECWIYIKSHKPDTYIVAKDGFGSAFQGDASLICVANSYGITNGILFYNQYQNIWVGHSNLETHRWYYITFVLNSTHHLLYIDGNLESYYASGGTIWNNNFPLFFGNVVDIGTWYSWNGTLDEVKMRKAPLSYSEIQDNWNNGKGKYLTVDSNTVGLWHLDEGSGIVTYDETFDNNDGNFAGLKNPSWATGFVIYPTSWPAAPRILIDEGHSEWLVSGNAQTLIQALEDRGFVVDAFTGTITHSLLSVYDAFLIGIAWSSFTQPEIQAIEDFVKDGGGLWLIGLGWSWVAYHPESTIYEYPMNQIAQRFGAFYNPDSIFDPTNYTTDSGSAIFHFPFIYNHPVTQGVSQIGATGAVIGSISIQTGNILITGDDDSYGAYNSPYPNPGMHPPMLAAIEYGSGRVIVGSHEWFFNDAHIYEYDNKILGLNIADWLAKRVATATSDIKPDTLNLKSKGQWITAYIELPEGYDISDIDVFTIMLNNTVSVDIFAPVEVGDYDEDGVPDLMIKFDRQEVIALLHVSEATTLTITGEVNGTSFEGSDTIQVITSRPKKYIIFNHHQARYNFHLPWAKILLRGS